MLHSIVGADDAQFKRCLSAIQRSYWPEPDFLARADLLPSWKAPPPDYQQIAETQSSIAQIASDVEQASHYVLFGDGGGAPSSYWLPYLSHFHKLFLAREWNQPYRDPKEKAANLFRLSRLPTAAREDNWSKNSGNYNHFVNVVAAAARLINYFSSHTHIAEIFGSHIRVFGTREAADDLFTSLSYDLTKGLRSFKLMLAAYYHDIGKAVVNERHAMEGYLLLTSHTSRAWTAFNRIAQAHNLFSPANSFGRDDLLNVADFVGHHDIFGTLTTGEAGYTKLCDVVLAATRAALRHDNRDTFTARSRRVLFDLWLLNCADIMVSVDNKFAIQDDLLTHEAACARIEGFLGRTTTRTLTKGGRLVHDLIIGYKILEKVIGQRHSFGSNDLEELAVEIAKVHGGERLRRLAVSTIPDSIGGTTDTYKRLREHIDQMSEESQTSAVVRSVECVASVNDFADRFARVGHLDYALSFFKRIATVAAEAVTGEIDSAATGAQPSGPVSNPFRTGWIRDRVDDLSRARDDTFFSIQARHFFDNYVSVLTEIIGHVLFRDRTLKGIVNVEFSDAANRLTQSESARIRELAAFDGPNRYRQAIHAILETIFLY